MAGALRRYPSLVQMTAPQFGRLALHPAIPLRGTRYLLK